MPTTRSSRPPRQASIAAYTLACKPDSPVTRGAKRKSTSSDELTPLKKLKPSSPPTSQKSTTPQTCTTTQPSTPDPLPNQLQSLLALHRALATTLALHAAHHGASPAPLSAIISSTTRLWRTRAVTLEDIARVLRLHNPGVRIADYGRTGYFIEIDEGWVREGEKEEAEREMRDLWDAWRGDTEDVQAFIQALPLLAVDKAETTDKIKPLTSLGATRLALLKQPPASTPHPQITVTGKQRPKATIAARTAALVATLSSKPQPSAPTQTPTTQKRINALHRIPSLSLSLPLPRAGVARSTYTLAELCTLLKDSARSVVAQDEVEGALRVFAEEDIGGGWVRFVEGKGVAGVVVEHGKRVGRGVLKERVEGEIRRLEGLGL